ncbi:MAG TPA: glycosyltransferase family 4 protein [Anaerolineales bacterium]|nr:glycosyltransferase family 4 protein [Anaerolineales bacterium]
MNTSPIPVIHLITRLIVGGAQENTLYTAALLDPTRFSVQILSGAQTGTEGSLIEEVRQQGIQLTILPDLVRQISPVHDLLALLKLIRYLRKSRCKVLHTHSSKAGILGRLAGRIAGTPVIIHTVHGWSFHEYMSPWLRKTYIFLERWMADSCQALIAVSQKDIQKGLQASIGRPQQYHLIRSAIPMEQFDPAHYDRQIIRQSLGIPDDAVVVGNIGRFSPQKNPLDWVRVASLIAAREEKAFFLLVGDGPMRAEVEEHLDQTGIRKRTILTGLRRDIPQLLAAMDIFLITSLWEGLPRVIPQAMAMGLPVLANSADGVQEIIQNGENGYLFQAGEIEQMAEVCVQLMHDPDQRMDLGQRGRESVLQAFDLQRMIEQITALYEKYI